MKKITHLAIILVLAFSLNATAQSSAVKKAAIADISEVSDMAYLFFPGWEQGLIYKVQILALKDPLQKKEDARLKKLGHVYSYKHDGLVKYTWGITRLPHEAARLQREMHRNGFKDAFVVHFYNGKRISREEAKVIREKNRLN